MSGPDYLYGKVRTYLGGEWNVTTNRWTVCRESRNERMAHVGFGSAADVTAAVAVGQRLFES